MRRLTSLVWTFLRICPWETPTSNLSPLGLLKNLAFCFVLWNILHHPNFFWLIKLKFGPSWITVVIFGVVLRYLPLVSLIAYRERLFDSSVMALSLPPFSLYLTVEKVSSLCLLYRYFMARTTRASFFGHPFRLRIPRHRTETYARYFFPCTSRVWNMLPRHVFPPAFNLQLFKSIINRLDLSTF